MERLSPDEDDAMLTKLERDNKRRAFAAKVIEVLRKIQPATVPQIADATGMSRPQVAAFLADAGEMMVRVDAEERWSVWDWGSGRDATASDAARDQLERDARDAKWQDAMGDDDDET